MSDTPRLLAFDTSTDRLSVAVQHGARRWVHAGAGGAQASATLIPTALDLLRQAGLPLAEVQAIVFGRGPGSFTGLRTAAAVAQGLALGAGGGRGVPVLPIDTLRAVAEAARAAEPAATHVLALLDARMDEVYSAAYVWDGSPGDGDGWTERAPIAVGPPEALALPPAAAGEAWHLAGNAFAPYGDRLPAALAALPRVQALPSAEALLDLAVPQVAAGRTLSAQAALPLYIRDKVAQTTAERAAQRAAR